MNDERRLYVYVFPRGRDLAFTSMMIFQCFVFFIQSQLLSQYKQIYATECRMSTNQSWLILDYLGEAG